MKVTPQFRMADRLAKGKLAEIITEGRAEGLSFDALSRQLFADFGIEVTSQTIANWVGVLADTEATA